MQIRRAAKAAPRSGANRLTKAGESPAAERFSSTVPGKCGDLAGDGQAFTGLAAAPI